MVFPIQKELNSALRAESRRKLNQNLLDKTEHMTD